MLDRISRIAANAIVLTKPIQNFRQFFRFAEYTRYFRLLTANRHRADQMCVCVCVEGSFSTVRCVQTFSHILYRCCCMSIYLSVCE